MFIKLFELTTRTFFAKHIDVHFKTLAYFDQRDLIFPALQMDLKAQIVRFKEL